MQAMEGMCKSVKESGFDVWESQMCSKWRLKSLGGWMAQHLQARLVSPRAGMWLEMEGYQICVGFLLIQYPWLHFLHQPPGYGLGGMVTQSSLLHKDQMWPRLLSRLFF